MPEEVRSLRQNANSVAASVLSRCHPPTMNSDSAAQTEFEEITQRGILNNKDHISPKRTYGPLSFSWFNFRFARYLGSVPCEPTRI